MLAGKLDYLMKLTDTSNSALGRELGFDPSYISRIRSGKRGLPRDRFFLEPAAAYFAHAIRDYPLRKSAAAEAVCPGRSWPEAETEAEKLLLGWLNQDERQDTERVDRLLNGLAAVRLLWPEAKLPAQREEPPSAAFYYGTEGKREAVLRLLIDYCAAEAPQELLVYSDEKIGWLSADEGYTRRWSDAVLRLIGRGVRIRIIHSIDRDWGEMLDELRKWLPVYLTGAVESWYCPKARDRIFRRTLIIARGCCAVTATAVGDGTGLNLLVSDPAAVEALTREYEDYLALCSPLVRIFSRENRGEVWELLRQFEAAPCSRIVAQRLPLGCTLPEEMIAAFGRLFARGAEDPPGPGDRPAPPPGQLPGGADGPDPGGHHAVRQGGAGLYLRPHRVPRYGVLRHGGTAHRFLLGISAAQCRPGPEPGTGDPAPGGIHGKAVICRRRAADENIARRERSGMQER